MQERFTIDGSDQLEERLSKTCDRVLNGLCSVLPKKKVEAIYLGGGYGRGEGGVLKTVEGDAPYNDLEFWVFLRGNRFLSERKYGSTLHTLEKVLSNEAGLDVEFKIASVDKLKKGPPTMFAYDLAMGHRRVFGHGGLLSDHHIRDGSQIPLFEATRLLMNRCSGLLYAQERLQRESFAEEEADFVGRNQAKAQLGFGDVVLTAFGQYHWSCRERNERLKKLSEDLANSNALAYKLPFSLAKIYCHHSLGLEFKLHPQKKKGSRESFLPLQNELLTLGLQLWLWLEGRRLNYTFNSARDYAFSEIDKCPETNAARNRLINLKTFGPGALLNGHATRYPRERLFHSLALLLWEPGTIENSFLLEKIQGELRTDVSTFSNLVAAYETLWRKFN